MYQTHSNRPFDRQSYSENDGRAKDAIKTFLRQNNFYDIKDKEDFYFDVSARRGESGRFLFEVEVKNQWGAEWNPSWSEVRIPGRKKRLLSLWQNSYSDHELFFVVFNTDCSKAWLIDGETLGKSPVGRIQNSTRAGSPHLKEPFYHVPIRNAKLLEIKA